MCIIKKNAQFDWTREWPIKMECTNERFKGCKQIRFVDRDSYESSSIVLMKVAFRAER